MFFSRLNKYISVTAYVVFIKDYNLVLSIVYMLFVGWQFSPV